MEAKWIAVTAIAPIAWGANYVVTRTWLPADAPLWGSAARALPAGLLLLAITRRLPRAHWWWRSAVLGTVNIGAFFLLVYLASQLLPSSVAASVMALSPFALALAGRALLGDELSGRLLAAATAGVLGVLLLIGGARDGLDAGGLLASVSALALSATGSVLAERWRDGTPVLVTTAWQLTWGGVLLTAVAVACEDPPEIGGPATWAAAAFAAVIATAVAFWCWFSGLARLPAGMVGVIGLLNPVTGILLGTGLAHEHLTLPQTLGIAVTLAGIAVAVAHPRSSGRPAAPDPIGAPRRFAVTSSET